MKALLITLGAVALLVLVTGGCTWGGYNGLVSADNEVERTWANVQSAYQQRLDTLPKFAQVVRVSTQFQIELQERYVKARNNVPVLAAASNGDAAKFQADVDKDFEQMMGSFRNFLNINVEATPQAKTEQLTELNSQIESVERVIKHERDAFNKAVKDKNDKVRRAPSSVVAGWFGFEKSKPFEASKEAQTSPQLDLDLDKKK
ncbi:MAG: LemA family protein [Candidatus Spechtbacteria bacterium]|nr:LemA family protein [Candidatus Spechtbacteria bacterium]